VALDGFQVRPRFHKFHAQRRHARARAMPGDREHPGETAFNQHARLGLIREQPAKLNAPLLLVLVLQDLFRASELFVTSHLLDGGAEIRRRERRERDGIKPFGLRFRSQQKTDRGIGADLAAHFADGPPQRKEFLGGEEHSRLVEKCLGKPGFAQHRCGTDSQLFQLLKRAPGDAKVFGHRVTPISEKPYRWRNGTSRPIGAVSRRLR